MRVDFAQIQEASGLKVKTKSGALPDSLKKGDTIDARVLSEDRGTAVLKTEDGQIVRARLNEGVSLKEGSEVTLEVTAKEEGFVFLAVSDREPDAKALPESTSTAGAARGFEDKSLEPFALKLRELGMPVREETAKVMRELIAENPKMSPDEAAFIASNGLLEDKALMKAALSMLSGGGKTDELVSAMIKLIKNPINSAPPQEGAAQSASQSESVPDAAYANQNAIPAGQDSAHISRPMSISSGGDLKPLTDWVTNIAQSGFDDSQEPVSASPEHPTEKPGSHINTSIPQKYITLQNEISTFNSKKSHILSENRGEAEKMNEIHVSDPNNRSIDDLQENPKLSEKPFGGESFLSQRSTAQEPSGAQSMKDTMPVQQDKNDMRQPPDSLPENSVSGKPAAQETEAVRQLAKNSESDAVLRLTKTPDSSTIERVQTEKTPESQFLQSAGKFENEPSMQSRAGRTVSAEQETKPENTVKQTEDFTKTPASEQNFRDVKTTDRAREFGIPVRTETQSEVLSRGSAERPEAVLRDTEHFMQEEQVVQPKANPAHGSDPAHKPQSSEREVFSDSAVSKTLAGILSEIPEFKGTPERALIRFSEMLLGAARDSTEVPGDFSEKLSVMLDKMFVRIEKNDENAGERLKKAKDELFMRLSMVEETVSGTQRHPARTELLEQTRKLMDHVRLVNNIEQFVYMQIPVKIGEERKTADLYLYKQKRGSKRIDPENVNILLSLDLDNVGHWESLVNVKGKDVSLRMEVSGEDIRDCFSENTVMLHKLLDEAGFKLAGTSISLSSSETTPLTALAALDRYKPGRSGAFDYTI